MQLDNIPHIKWFRGDVLLTSLVINLLTLALPLVLLQVYDRIIPNDAMATFSYLIIGLTGVIAIDAVLKILRYNVTSWDGVKFEHTANCYAINKYLKSKIIDYEKESPGVHIDRVGSVEYLKDFFANQILVTLIDLPFVLLFIALIAFIGGPIAFVPLIIMGLLLIVSYVTGEQLKQRLKERNTTDDRKYNFVLDVLSGIHDVKGLALEQQMLRRHERLQETSSLIGKKISYISAVSQNLGNLFSQVTLVSVVSFGSVYVIDGSLTIGSLAACTILSSRTIQPMMKVMGMWTSFQNIRIARKKMDSLKNLSSEQEGVKYDFKGLKQEIEIKNLHFSFEDGKNELYRDLNLIVKAGECISIKGNSGKGKTTLLQILSSLIVPEEGDVLFDGISVKEYDKFTLRQHIAYLPQKPILFQGTILENLTSFQADHNLEKAMEIAKLLDLEKDILQLPEGLNTQVGSNSAYALPTGIQQRISITRSLASNPSVVLFDEANTGFDINGDQILLDALKTLKGKATVIIVSHRPSYLNIADTVYEIKNKNLNILRENKPSHATDAGDQTSNILISKSSL